FHIEQRHEGASAQQVTPDQMGTMCVRAFGADTRVTAAIELGTGSYNTTYRVDIGAARPVILRAAPERARRNRTEPGLVRNEPATVPHLAPIAAMLPRTLAIDFTHQVIGRDYVFQSLLDGVPAPDGLSAYPRPAWAAFYRQLGALTRRINAVRG